LTANRNQNAAICRSCTGSYSGVSPNCELWFLDSKDSTGKIVSNPNIGYGSWKLKNVDKKTRKFYQIGISTNTAGISVNIMGIKDKTFLARTYGKISAKPV
jgi:hypothetical protein